MAAHSGGTGTGREDAGGRRYRWRVAIVEDHLLQRRRAEELVAAQSGLSIVWSGETMREFLAWFQKAPTRQRPHLLLLDLRVDRGPSVEPEQVRDIVRVGVKVLVVSAMSSPELVRQVLRAGIAGVVGKRDREADLVAAIWTVLGRGQWFSPELAGIIGVEEERPRLSDQEERALVLYASGSSMVEVAERLGVQANTAKKYLSRVKAKYAAVGRIVRTRLELNHAAQRDGYLDGPGRD